MSDWLIQLAVIVGTITSWELIKSCVRDVRSGRKDWQGRRRQL